MRVVVDLSGPSIIAMIDGPDKSTTDREPYTTLFRSVEAEQADEVRGPQILNSGNASGGRFIGAINHGHD